jgi:hypothetical protein
MALELLAGVFAITLPFGMWRATTRRLSLWWFLAIHVPIPFIFLARIEAGYPYTFIPFTVSACLAGQLVGGKIGSLLLQRRTSGRDLTTPETAVASVGNDTSAGHHDAKRRAGVSG